MGNNKSMQYCRVCGLFQGQDFEGNDFFPWGRNGNSPSFEFCDCCGVEFGYTDCFPEDVKAFREEWLKRGHPWSCPEDKPENWSLEEQLKNIPEEFR